MSRKSLLLGQDKRHFKQFLVLFMALLFVFIGVFPNGLPVKAATPTVTTDVCSQQQNQVALINGSFERPVLNNSKPANIFVPAANVPGWKTTDVKNQIEIWRPKDGLPYKIGQTDPLGVPTPAPAEGDQYAELNAWSAGLLYQDIKTTPGQKIYWRLSHRARFGVDTMSLRIGPVGRTPQDTPLVRRMSDGTGAWGHYEGTYTVPAGQTITRFGFEAVSTGSQNIGAGNFLDDLFIGTTPCVTATKSVDKDRLIHAGDELTYKVNVKNYGGDIAADSVFTDAIPDGTEYVPGSIKVMKNGIETSVTDAVDGDTGDFQSNKVTVKLGDLPNTNNAVEGFTVQFKVKAKSGNIGKVITNKAQVQYQNLLEKKQEQTETNEVVNEIVFKDPAIESEKTVRNLQNKSTEVGDTLEYTIRTRNTVSDSLIKNLVIADTLPEGLEYVPGTLQLDGKTVTDAADQDNGQFVTGKVTGKFGDVTDTNWHTVVFHAKVKPGQAGKNIINTGDVTGDNVPPQNPKTDTPVYPKPPNLESTKTAKNTQDKKIEVGDEIEYTIKARNTVSDSLIKNLVIADTLPEGLEYVPRTLQVDGKAVTDAEDQDNGQFVIGKVTGKFGDVTDTNWHTVVFHAKVKEGQADKVIENIANVTGDNMPPQNPSTNIKVSPLPTGQFEIEKVDAKDANLKLKNAVFQILDKDGKEVGKLTTGENGKAVSEQLLFGTYTIKEVQAPNGYMLLRGSIEVKINSTTSIQKIRVENTKSEWDIPNTGGVGTNIFYVIGAFLMVITLFLFVRKRNID
ncbi:hypothetical protein CON64_06785 [Bacillus pseudomycoides]|nr:hypothetical protein CON64_06785 [Bacillus pseudomycoides]